MNIKRLSSIKIGYKIKFLRNLNHFTISDFSNIIGVSITSLLKWETGKHIPSLENIVKICNLFKINIEELVLYEN